MSEIDLRKLPMHRKFEAYEKVRMIFLQKLWEQDKMTHENVKLLRKEIWESMNAFEEGHSKKIQCWMDFGEAYIKSLGLKDG